MCLDIYMSDFLRILENEVQIAALSFLVIVYFLRIIWLLRFRSIHERTYPAGDSRKGIRSSIMNIGMPWTMESTRKNFGFYLQFVLFHVGILVAISATFIIPYWPSLFTVKAVVLLFQAIIGAAFVVGLIRIYRRLFQPAIRLISTPDDYFSLVLLTLYFVAAFITIPTSYESREWAFIVFFGMTAFFLVYVPFSKIGHYLYYPFTRYFLGKTMGHRGVGTRKT